MSHIFISYSHKDIEIAQGIVDALAADNLDTWIDWKSIPKGEDWIQEIYRGIEEADAFLFLVSPESVASSVCNQEIIHATKNGKRILPLFIHNVPDSEVYRVGANFLDPDAKKEILRRNFIFCRPGLDDFRKAIEETRRTIHTDYEWLQYHTKLQGKALDWDRREHARDTSRLLRGKELRGAELKLVGVTSQADPQPTVLQQQYVRASRRQEERQQRRLMVGLGAGCLVLTLVSIFAWRQSQATVTQANLRATAQAQAEQQARISLSRKLAAAAQTVRSDHPQESLLLAVEALKALQPGDPSIPDAEQSLRDALLHSGGIALGQGNAAGVAPVFSPDTHWLAAGSEAGVIRLWDLTPSQPVDPLQLPTAQAGPVQAIAISDDSRWLVAASSQTRVQLWELTGFHPENKPLELSVDGCPIYLLKTSPDNRWLVIVCGDNSVRVWDLAAHDPALPPMTLPQMEVSTNPGIFSPEVAFLPGDREQLLGLSQDSRWLALASDNRALLWDLETSGSSARPAVLAGYKFPVTALAFSPDHHWVAVADAKTILLWDLTGPDPAANPLQLSDHFQVASIAFHPGGTLLAAGNSDGVVRLWDLTAADPAKAYIDVEGQTPFLNDLTFSPDRRWMITAGRDVRLLDISNGLYTATPILLRGNEYPVLAVRVSSDSRWLVSLDNDASLRLWDLLSHQPSASPVSLWAHQGFGRIQAMATSPSENRWLATAGGNGVALWDMNVRDFQSSPVFLNEINANSLAISPDNRWLAAGGQDGAAALWDLQALSTNQSPVLLEGHTGAVTTVAFSAGGRWLATGSQDQSVRLWDLVAAHPVDTATTLPGQCGSISKLAFSPDGRWLAAVGGQDSLLWELSGEAPSQSQPIRLGHEIAVEHAVFSADSHRLAIGAEHIRLLDLSSPNVEMAASFPGLGTPLALSPDNLWLVARKDDLLQLLDLSDLASEPMPLTGHEGRVTGLAFSPDGNLLFTGSWDDTARIWDMRSRDPVASAVTLHSPEAWLPHIETLAVTPDGRWLATGTEGGVVSLWAVQRAELVELACRSAGRNLYPVEWDQYFTGERQKTCARWP